MVAPREYKILHDFHKVVKGQGHTASGSLDTRNQLLIIFKSFCVKTMSHIMVVCSR